MQHWLLLKTHVERITALQFAYLVGFVVVALYGTSINWGFVGLDDTLLLERNGHLQRNWEGIKWACTDVAFGRRWTPLFWLQAEIVGPSAFGYRAYSLALAIFLCVSLFHLLALHTTPARAFLLTLWYESSPLRWECFGWGIGFLYTSLSIFVVWSLIFHAQQKPSLSTLCSVCSLLIYPIAAGFVAYQAVLSRSWRSAVVLVCLVILACYQWHLRRAIGFLPVQRHYAQAVLAVAHYACAMVVPIGSVPIVSPLWHVGAIASLFGVGFLAAVAPRQLCTLLIVFSPVCLAAVTEAFWFCGRYAMVSSIMVCWCLAKTRATLWLMILVGTLVVGNLTLSSRHYGFRSLADCIARASSEEKLLYGNDKALRSVLRTPGTPVSSQVGGPAVPMASPENADR